MVAAGQLRWGTHPLGFAEQKIGLYTREDNSEVVWQVVRHSLAFSESAEGCRVRLLLGLFVRISSIQCGKQTLTFIRCRVVIVAVVS